MDERYPKPIYGIQIIKKKAIVGWKQKCALCGRIFESRRKDATYCPESSGRRCRLKAHRAQS